MATATKKSGRKEWAGKVTEAIGEAMTEQAKGAKEGGEVVNVPRLVDAPSSVQVQIKEVPIDREKEVEVSDLDLYFAAAKLMEPIAGRLALKVKSELTEVHKAGRAHGKMFDGKVKGYVKNSGGGGARIDALQFCNRVIDLIQQKKLTAEQLAPCLSIISTSKIGFLAPDEVKGMMVANNSAGGGLSFCFDLDAEDLNDDECIQALEKLVRGLKARKDKDLPALRQKLPKYGKKSEE